MKVCEVCNIQLLDDYAYQGHITGKRHLKNKNRIKESQLSADRSIFVAKIPSRFLKDEVKNELLQFFEKYGEFEYHKFGLQSLIVEFTSINPAKLLLSEEVYFKNQKLNIVPRIIKDNYNNALLKKKVDKKLPDTINNTEELNFDNVKAVLATDLSFNDQVSKFLDAISISPDEIQTIYESTCTRLQQVFQKNFNSCKTYRFGSTVSGLGFKNCDLDVYLDIGKPITNESDIPKGFESSSSVFSKVKRILFSKPQLFSKVVPIPKAKTPIIKFTFVPTNISCDVSFKNSLAVYNSQLMKHYLTMNEILRPTMMILKYWISNYELRGGIKMSKYALTLLFMFYCQQPFVNLVPPVCELKNKIQPKIVEGWQVNFNETKPKLDSTIDNIPQLLFGFFDFYSNYNFKVNVVCPVDGISHKKIMLNSVETLPDSMEFYKEYLKSRNNTCTFPLNKPMCVQDVNELNHNVTGNIPAMYLEAFQKHCEIAATLCKTEINNDHKKLLTLLFALEITIPKTPKDTSVVTFVFSPDKKINFEYLNDNDSDNDKEEKWFDLVTSLVKNFFEKVLKLQVQIVERQELKQQKIDTNSDVHSRDKGQILMNCVGDACLWRDRKTGSTNIDPSMSLLEKEIFITDTIYERLKSINRLIYEKIDFECNILKKIDKVAYLIIKLSNNNCTKAIFDEIASYIKNKLVFVLEKTLLHMKQFKKIC